MVAAVPAIAIGPMTGVDSLDQALDLLCRILSALALVEDLKSQQATVAASIREQTMAFGLSLGDRACLALGMVRDLPVVTADRDWKKTGLGVDVRVFR